MTFATAFIEYLLSTSPAVNVIVDAL